MKAVVMDGKGHEVIGSIDVIKVEHPDEDRPYHLELGVSDDVLQELVKYGSEIFGHMDLLHTGLRGALLERLARENEK